MADKIWVSVARSLKNWKTLRVWARTEPGEFFAPESEEPFASVVKNDASADDDSPSLNLRHENALQMDVDEFRRRVGR